MNNFTYEQAGSVADAVQAIATRSSSAQFLGGGTNLVDLMKEQVAHPAHLVGITRLPLADIDETPEGGLRLGALATNAVVAAHPAVVQRYPVLAQAILAGASPQLRNMATMGGNLLQRTRCCYFYDVGTPCNKREPGTGCPAIRGVNRMHAILGTSEQCIATHPSDMCVALAALEATVRVTGTQGERAIPFEAFHRLPGDTPHLDTNLRPGELITSVDLPPNGFAAHGTYMKVRDRASYAFALVSAAVLLEIAGDAIADVRIALGGVAHKPWRNREVEDLLRGKPCQVEHYRQAADEMVADARGFGLNTFKIELARRVIVRALQQAAAGPDASRARAVGGSS